MRDYTTHYRADADLIVDPARLPPVRFASESRRLTAIVRHLGLQPGERLLDLGCGSGWLSDLCARSGAQVVACDVAPAGVAAARARYPASGSFVVGDVYAVGLKSNVADVIVLSEVLEHLQDIPAAVRELKRLLRPGGRLMVTVPNRETIVKHLCIHCNSLTPANAHLHSFDAASLGVALQEHGLAVRKTVLLSNKLLELIGFPHKSRWLPHLGWRGIDWLCNRIIGRAGFLLILAVNEEAA
jgi:SAM-dependent methyltransferase